MKRHERIIHLNISISPSCHKYYDKWQHTSLPYDTSIHPMRVILGKNHTSASKIKPCPLHANKNQIVNTATKNSPATKWNFVLTTDPDLKLLLCYSTQYIISFQKFYNFNSKNIFLRLEFAYPFVMGMGQGSIFYFVLCYAIINKILPSSIPFLTDKIGYSDKIISSDIHYSKS